MESTIVSFLLVSFSCIFGVTTIKNQPYEEMELLMERKFETDDLKKQYVAYKLYKQQYNKMETNARIEYRRFATYMDNAEKIRKHNERYRLGKETYKMTINEFADMLPEEFTKRNGYQRAFRRLSNDIINLVALPNVTKLPDFVDWRENGAVSKVKNQGHCGSCWAFSATGALEGQHFRKTGKLVSLSEQNLIDCSVEYGSDGCSGGLMDQAFDYVIDNNGIDTEASYPYVGKASDCKYKVTNRGATARRRINLPEGDEEELRRAVATVGPISVAVDATWNLHFYGEGIFSNNYCSSTDVNHGVLVVGYGNEIIKTENGRNKTIAYWILKNSWGSKWGEFGYFKLLSGRNMCGIASAASYPLIE